MTGLLIFSLGFAVTILAAEGLERWILGKKR